MPWQRRQGRRRAPARRIAPLVLLAAALAVAEAPALADGFAGTLAISSIVRPSSPGGLAQVLAQASVTPQCDQAGCSWQPVVETVAPEQACVPSTGDRVWSGTAYAAAAPESFSPSWYELPAATAVVRRACLFAQAGGQETLVAQALYRIPARSAPAPGATPDPGLLRTAIPGWVAPVRRRWPFRVSTANVPPGVAARRFVALARAAGARWGLRYSGTTRSAVRIGDGRSTVGFAHLLPPGALGLTDVEVAVFRRGGRVVARRVVEEDTRFLYGAPWDPGPALPDDRHVDLETVILHELGHYAGNGHAPNCRDTPMWPALGPGEWWHSPTDWFQRGCGIATSAARRAAATPATTPRRLLVRVHERVVTLH